MYASLKKYTLYDCIELLLQLPDIIYIFPEVVWFCQPPWKLYGELEVISIVPCISVTNIIC